MKKVVRLIWVQLWAVLGDMLSIGKSKNKKPKAIYAGVAFFLLLMSGVSFFYSLMIGSVLKVYHSTDILPSMMIAVACIILFFTTMFKVKGTVFGFKDYDMVMALPISTSGIIASRVFILYAINILFVIILIVPMMIAYGILMTPSPIFFIYGFITLLFVPLVPIVLASLLGTVIAYLASKFRYHNILNIIFSMGFIAVIIGFSISIDDNAQKLINMSNEIAAQVNAIYPLAQLYTRAVVEYDTASLLLFVVISVVAFFLYIVIVKAIFKKLNTAIMTGSYHRSYKLDQLKTSSPLKALYLKELKRYFSSSVYVVNTAFAVLMLTAGAVALFFVDVEKVIGGEIPRDAISMVGPIFIIFCISMCCTTMSSISLEGKSLWILKSLPVDAKTVYLSKIAVNLTVLSPCLVDAVLLGLALKLDFLEGLLLVLMTAVCCIFISSYGLLINLLLPNFDWSNETVVVKQSAACVITILSGMLLCVIPIVLILLLPSDIFAYLVIIVLFAGIDVALYVLLTGYGKRRYAQL